MSSPRATQLPFEPLRVGATGCWNGVVIYLRHGVVIYLRHEVVPETPASTAE